MLARGFLALPRRALLAGTAALTVAAAAGTAAPALAQEPQYGGVLQMSWSTLDTSDFHRHTGTISVPHPFAETLTSLSRDGQPQPFLAESWEISDDGLTYTFTIREGVRFHNGREMTSADILANFERVRQEIESGWLTSAMKQVESFSTPDDRTFVVRLTDPFAPFLNLIAELWIIAPESPGWDDRITQPIGTGPFEFTEWVPQLRLHGERFDDYWMDGLPYLDAIEFDLREVADPSLALRAGDYHLAMVPITKAPSIETDPETELQFRGDTGWIFWSFNNREPRPPFDDVRVREAITHAMHKEALLTIAGGEYGIPTNQMVVEGNFYYDPELGAADEHAQPDLDRARALLDEAGVDPSEHTVRVISHQNSRYAEPTLQMVRQLGFDVEHRSYDDLGYQKALSEYEWDLFPGGSGPRNDVFLRFVRMMSDGPNPHLWGGVQNAEYDRLVTAAISTVDPQERWQHYRDAWQLVMDNYWTVVVGHVPSVAGVRSEVEGFEFAFNNSPHRVDGGVAFTWLAD